MDKNTVKMNSGALKNDQMGKKDGGYWILDTGCPASLSFAEASWLLDSGGLMLSSAWIT